jgi:uncharacterized membrane protein YbhN (UPF0104 family)
LDYDSIPIVAGVIRAEVTDAHGLQATAGWIALVRTHCGHDGWRVSMILDTYCVSNPGLSPQDPSLDSQKQKRVLRLLENVLGLASLGAVGWYIWLKRHEFLSLLDLSPFDLTVIVVGVIGAWLCNAWQSLLLYRAEGKSVGVFENIMLVCAANFGNYMPLRAGTLVRATYMKHVHNLAYSRTGSIFGIRVVLMVISTGCLGLCGVFGLAASGGRFSFELLAVFLGLIALAFVAFIAPLPKFGDRPGRMGRAWADFRAGFGMIKSRLDVTLQVCAIMLLQHAVIGVRLGVALDSVGVQVSFFTLMILAPLLGLATFISIVPGAIGIREALMGYVSYATGTEFSRGLFAATVDRVVMLALTATLGLWGFIYVWQRTRIISR